MTRQRQLTLTKPCMDGNMMAEKDNRIGVDYLNAMRDARMRCTMRDARMRCAMLGCDARC